MHTSFHQLSDSKLRRRGVQHFLVRLDISSEFVLGVSLFAEEMPPRASTPSNTPEPLPSNAPQSSIPTLNPLNLVHGGTVGGVSSFLLSKLKTFGKRVAKFLAFLG